MIAHNYALIYCTFYYTFYYFTKIYIFKFLLRKFQNLFTYNNNVIIETF